MPAIPRPTILKRLHQMVASGIPIIGGSAGTGPSAKSEEAGGIDLIILYNSGRYPMAGRGSASGLLAYGNANQIVREMAVEVLPVVKHTPGAGATADDRNAACHHLVQAFQDGRAGDGGHANLRSLRAKRWRRRQRRGG